MDCLLHCQRCHRVAGCQQRLTHLQRHQDCGAHLHVLLPHPLGQFPAGDVPVSPRQCLLPQLHDPQERVADRPRAERDDDPDLGAGLPAAAPLPALPGHCGLLLPLLPREVLPGHHPHAELPGGGAGRGGLHYLPTLPPSPCAQCKPSVRTHGTRYRRNW